MTFDGAAQPSFRRIIAISQVKPLLPGIVSVTNILLAKEGC